MATIDDVNNLNNDENSSQYSGKRELKLTKEEMDKAMERFNTVMLATEDGIWDWDIVTSKVYFSPAWQTMLGYEVGEIEQNLEAWVSILHPDDLEPTIAHAQKFIKNESSEYKMEFRMLCKDGSYKWVLARAKDAERDEKGDVTRIIGTHVDIQERKTHERELIKANEYAETRIVEEIKKNKEKEKILYQQSKLAAMGDMIENIAHQWRQPLSAISTGASGMKLQKEYGNLSDEMFNNTCDAIDRNAQYLSKTIDDFRNFIKGDRNKKIFSLTNEINSFLLLVEGTIKSNNISIVLELENDIKINGYSNELIQCFINIFNNAKDILNEKKVDDKLIFISSYLEDNKAVIKIKDNAGGVPVNVLPRIFEPYFTTKHQSQGTGLGLHMTYNLIVDGMNGTIKSNNVSYKYEETDYVGAEFTIVLSLT